jgi:3-deoxy-D-manno-octulosonic acid kinase
MLYAENVGIAGGPEVVNPLAYGSHATLVTQGGRQAAWFVEGVFGQGVLRQYRRGGLIACMSADAYIWCGANATRSFSEFRIMSRLHAQGLRVPPPLAAAYWRHGLLYRAALLTRQIPGAQPLACMIDRALLPQVAQAVAAMHQAGVWHADLNAYNILVDQADEVWLIDFDRATYGGLTDRKREANLQRLTRSLHKVAGEVGQRMGRELIDLYAQAYQT